MPRSVHKQIRRRHARRARRYRKRARPTTVVQRGVGPIAPRTICRLRYCSSISRNLSSGIPADNVYRLNSVFDPDFTGGGTQPYGHDTYANLYNRYRVFAAAYKVILSCSGSQPANFTVVPTNSTASISDFELAREMPRAISATGGATGASPVILRGHLSLPALNGQTKVQYMSDDRFQSVVGADPTEVLALHIVQHSADNVTIRAIIEIIFFVEFFDPTTLSKS